MQAQWQRQELLANNLANASTPGYKQDHLVATPTGVVMPQYTPILDLTSIGTVAQWTDFTQGPIRETGRNLDAAINGNGFFVVDTPNGERYTRAGAFMVGQGGFLTTADGLNVQGQRGPIAIKTGQVTINEAGDVFDGARKVDTLRVVDFPRPYRLAKEGHALFVPADKDVLPQPAKDHQIIGGALEHANVNSVQTMVGMIELLRTYEAYQRAIQSTDEADQKAINEIGRV